MWKNRLIPQCEKCQLYGHTRKYCHADDIYVRCGSHHDTKVCVKAGELPTTYANCGEVEPKNLQKHKQERPFVQKSAPRILTSNKITNDISYANNTQNKNQTVPEANRAPVNQDAEIKEIMQNKIKLIKQINSMFDALKARVTGAIPKTKAFNGQ